jgi:ABC-type amino acid transport substrate-binding protein
MTNHRLIAIAALILVAAAAGIGLFAWGRAGESAWERVQNTGTLKVGIDASFPPLASVDARGWIVGFEADLIHAVADRLGVEVAFTNISFDGLYDSLAVGRVDVLISGLSIDPERTADFTYTAPYFDAGLYLVSAGCAVAEMADLEGGTVAVAFGSLGDAEARAWERRLAVLNVISPDTAAAALEAVRAGEADAVLVDHISALTFVREAGVLCIAPDPVIADPYAIVTRAEDRRLHAEIDAALAELAEDGTLAAIMASSF